MIFKYKFCLWLIDTLSIQSLTLPEIQKKWLNASANEDGDPLAERTFNRYRREAEALMYVDIKCDKRNGNIYKILRPEGFKNDQLQQWLLSAFRISNLSERVKQREDVIIESAPPAAHLLQTVMEVIDRKQTMKFNYKSHFQDEKEIELIPAFVRLFKQRWYVIGEVKGKEYCMTCALERIKGKTEIEIGKKTTISKKNRSLLTPQAYFEHCFGIIRQHEPITIRLRAFWPEDAYIRDVPIHSSQIEIAHTENYTDFEIYVRPTYDLKQELLWHRDKLAVLSPEPFKQQMIQILQAISSGYKTGECHAIDE